MTKKKMWQCATNDFNIAVHHGMVTASPVTGVQGQSPLSMSKKTFNLMSESKPTLHEKHEEKCLEKARTRLEQLRGPMRRVDRELEDAKAQVWKKENQIEKAKDKDVSVTMFSALTDNVFTLMYL